MTKVAIRTLDSVTNNDTTATQLINENFQALQTAIENTISRDGTTPNFMDANLDLNSYKIINAGTPTNNTDVITKEYFDQNIGDAAGYAEAAEQSANRAATSAQVAQGYSNAAAGAADVAQNARDFIESDPGFQTVSEDLLLGEDSEIRKANANKTNIDTVAGSITNVNTVGNDIANVNSVANNLTNIDTVADDLTNIDTVANNITNVNAVGNDIVKVTAVADDLTNIDAVNSNKTNIDTVAANAVVVSTVAENIENTNAVGNDIANVNAVAADITKVTAVADDLTNIDAVNANKTNINTVAGINANVTTVAGIASDVTAVAGNNTDISAVAADLTKVDTVSANITNVNTVAGISSDVTTVAGISSDVSAVENIASDVTTVAGISSDVTAVSGNNTDISTVADDIVNVNTVATDITNVNTVAADLTNIDAVNANKTNIDTVANNETSINKVANKITEVDTVAWISGDVTTVAGNSTNINTVAGVSSNVTTVANNISDVNTVVTNITDIQNASANAQLAKDWANKTNGTVDGSEYSSKYYAEQAATILNSKQDQLTSANAGTGISITGSGGNIKINNTQTSAEWGNITGTLSNQTDLNTALNTKYDASNPNGYTSNVGTVTSVNNVSPVNGNVSLSIPTVDQTYDATSANAQSGVAVASAISGKADDSDVVHKTGTETITGFKTFTNQAKITSSTSGAILELESGESNTNFLLKRTGGSTCVLESGATAGLFGTQSEHPLQIRTNYENRMTFDTSGNVTLAKAPSSNSNSNQVATTAWTVSKIPTNNNQLTNGAGYITGINSSDVTSALGYTPVNPSNLATVATSGSYNDLSNKPTIPTVNDATLTITQGGTTKGTFTANASSNVTIDLDAGGSIDVDNKSITTNSSDELQTVGVINSRDTSTAIKTWTGTKAQYDAIVTKDANTLYNITDDTDVSLTILEALYPVGSVYITTANTCPLSALISGSTWELVSSGRVLQGADSGHSAGTTIEAGLPNITGRGYDGIGGGSDTQANQTAEGALYCGNSKNAWNAHYAGTATENVPALSFDASRSSSIYGNSTTVQPPAYIVNIYRRVS